MHKKESIEATCPECRGPLSLYREDGLVEIRCLVDHAYSPMSLLQAHTEAQETAIWAAIVALRETAAIVDSLSTEFPPAVFERIRIQVEKKQQQAAILEAVVADLEPFDIQAPDQYERLLK
jgi:hypothetical protein